MTNSCLHRKWKYTAWSSWTSRACLFELHTVFNVLFFALREVVGLLGRVYSNFTLFLTWWFFYVVFFALREVIELLGHLYLNFTLFHFFVLFLIWNTHYVVRELPVVITLNFSLVWENYFKTQKITYFYVFWTSKYTVNLSQKNCSTLPRRALELLATIFPCMSCF